MFLVQSSLRLHGADTPSKSKSEANEIGTFGLWVGFVT